MQMGEGLFANISPDGSNTGPSESVWVSGPLKWVFTMTDDQCKFRLTDKQGHNKDECEVPCEDEANQADCEATVDANGEDCHWHRQRSIGLNVTSGPL